MMFETMSNMLASIFGNNINSKPCTAKEVLMYKDEKIEIK